MKHTPEEIKYRLSNIGEAIGNIALDYITDLEKENAELKKQVEKHKWNDIFLEDCAVYDKKIAEEYTTSQERITKLEKENAELRERIKTLEQIKQEHTDYTIKVEEERTFVKDQLTKATKIIKELCGMVRELNKPNVQLTNIDYSLSEAKQFISKVEK